MTAGHRRPPNRTTAQARTKTQGPVRQAEMGARPVEQHRTRLGYLTNHGPRRTSWPQRDGSRGASAPPGTSAPERFCAVTVTRSARPWRRQLAAAQRHPEPENRRRQTPDCGSAPPAAQATGTYTVLRTQISGTGGDRRVLAASAHENPGQETRSTPRAGHPAEGQAQWRELRKDPAPGQLIWFGAGRPRPPVRRASRTAETFARPPGLAAAAVRPIHQATAHGRHQGNGDRS